MGHYMSKKAGTKVSTGTAESARMDTLRDINRIARAVIKRSIATEALLTTECLEVAHEHYLEISEVYRRVWNKVKSSDKLHPTHPAGKTEAYHVLRERGER